MDRTDYLPVHEYADICALDVTIIEELADFGLIKLYEVSRIKCVRIEEMRDVDRVIRLYRDLGVNAEGIEVILRMRAEMEAMRQELHSMQSFQKRLYHEYKMRVNNSA